MKSILPAILSLTLSASSYANLYECKNTDGMPTPVLSESRTEFTKTNAHIFPNALDEKVHSKKLKPFLIYYAVDSTEPFMKLTVKYEIARMKMACEQSENVNFIAFLNSSYIEKNEFIVCKNQVYSELKFSTFPTLNKSLQIKRNFIKTGDHTGNELGPMDYLVRYNPNINEAFGNFPLAHPDFLYDLVSLATTDKSLFPASQFMPFLNLKSHGSKTNVLSGLQSCQTMAKTMSQDIALKEVLSASELAYLETNDFDKSIEQVDSILNKIGIGSLAGVGGESLGGTNLGGTNLGGTNLGGTNLGGTNLSDAVAGLGAGEGLGAEFSFGLYHVGLTAVLSHLFNEENEMLLGFAMLESCDTNRNIEFHHASITNVLGIYSAEHSLWYRNINWWTLLSEANGSTLRLVELLTLNTGNIVNIVTTDN
jgi:hypothetical protein